MTDDSASILYENMKFEQMEMEVIREEVPPVGNQSGLYGDILI